MTEAEAVLTATGDVDRVYFQRANWSEWRRGVRQRALYHDGFGILSHRNPGLEPLHLQSTYDLLVLICPQAYDVLNINAIKNWKKHCRVSVCWVDELWAHSVHDFRYWLPILAEFDHVILALSGSLKPVSDALRKRCHFVPAGVDAIRFSPFPDAARRVIDVYSIGRRQEGMHQAFRRIAAERNLFYLYDSIENGGDQRVRDLDSHRDLYASIAKRSRYFTVAPAKFDLTDHTISQVEVPFRYFEGVASGAILIGQVPQCQSFQELFDWPDAVVEVQPDGSDLEAALSDLDANPFKQCAIHRRNASQALLRHDWVYRWIQILAVAGFEPTHEMQARVRQLQRLATLADSPQSPESDTPRQPVTGN